MNTRNLDVSGLPDHAFGSRSLLWWGTIGFIAVEGAVFAVLIATYLYGMGRVNEWPPDGQPPRLMFGVITTAILLLSLWPNVIYKRAADRLDYFKARRWLLVAVVLETALLVTRGFEFVALEVSWDDHFYGSILWTVLGFHTLHLFSDWVETLVLLAIGYRKPPTPHRCRDMSENALYWNFVVLVWLPLFALIYLLPRFTS